MKKVLNEFKEFAMKGNMIDMAIGIVIGAAFSTVVKSLVDDILMPIVSGIFKAPDFSNLFVVVRRPAEMAGEMFTSVDAAREAGAAVLAYGLFINAIIAFVIVAFALFMVVKGINKMKKEAPVEPEAAPEPSGEEKLLMEIRDALKNRN